MTDKAIGIVRFARRLRFAVWSLALLLTLAAAAAILLNFSGKPAGAFVDSHGLPRAWAARVAATSVGLVLAGLFELGRMLRLVEADAAFSPPATRHLKRFAALLMAAVLVDVLAPTIIQLTLYSALALSLASSDMLLLLVSIVFFLISRLLDAAAVYQEDSRSIV